MSHGPRPVTHWLPSVDNQVSCPASVTSPCSTYARASQPLSSSCSLRSSLGEVFQGSVFTVDQGTVILEQFSSSSSADSKVQRASPSACLSLCHPLSSVGASSHRRHTRSSMQKTLRR